MLEEAVFESVDLVFHFFGEIVDALCGDWNTVM